MLSLSTLSSLILFFNISIVVLTCIAFFAKDVFSVVIKLLLRSFSAISNKVEIFVFDSVRILVITNSVIDPFVFI